jgi:hypothetical protein
MPYFDGSESGGLIWQVSAFVLRLGFDLGTVTDFGARRCLQIASRVLVECHVK